MLYLLGTMLLSSDLRSHSQTKLQSWTVFLFIMQLEIETQTDEILPLKTQIQMSLTSKGGFSYHTTRGRFNQRVNFQREVGAMEALVSVLSSRWRPTFIHDFLSLRKAGLWFAMWVRIVAPRGRLAYWGRNAENAGSISVTFC